jgi:hypothetical protein
MLVVIPIAGGDQRFGDDVYTPFVRATDGNELMCQSMVAELFVPASAYRVFENPKNIAGHYSFLAPLSEFCDAYLGISRNAAVNNTFDVHV